MHRAQIAFATASVAMALAACGSSKPEPTASSSSQLALAQCMRAHGVPNFPDPVFPAGGGIELRVAPGVNPQSPAFQQAAKA